jgi:predicted transcriptional regulator
LQVLWRRRAATVREVQEELGEGTGYTTVLKFLQIMTEKGLVRRDETERAHVYRATLSESVTQQQLLSVLMKRAFAGSTSRLVLQALASKKASPAELAEIRQMIRKLTKER